MCCCTAELLPAGARSVSQTPPSRRGSHDDGTLGRKTNTFIKRAGGSANFKIRRWYVALLSAPVSSEEEGGRGRCEGQTHKHTLPGVRPLSAECCWAISASLSPYNGSLAQCSTFRAGTARWAIWTPVHWWTEATPQSKRPGENNVAPARHAPPPPFCHRRHRNAVRV